MTALCLVRADTSLLDAEKAAVPLADKWYRKDGITSFGKQQLKTFDEMQEYYSSEAYIESGDAAHICIESLDPKDLL